MKFRNLFLLGLLSVLVFGCARFDYYPRGIHKNEGKVVGKLNKSAYIVKKGDTLYSIGRKFSVDFHVLAKRNGIRKPYQIFVGQRVFVKGYAPKTSKYTKKKNTPKKVKTVKASNKKSYPSAAHSRVKLAWPVKGRLSSRFGPRDNRMHDGIDIAAAKGVHVFAAADGKVVYADSRLSGYGNLIIVRHTTDMFTAYAHNQKNLVKRGQKVKAGQHIANVGTSGRSTGSHLHFEVRRGETAVDPLAYLPKR
ncbi:MAG: M23 family metallopeptidase [Ghiorsea sp.]